MAEALPSRATAALGALLYETPAQAPQRSPQLGTATGEEAELLGLEEETAGEVRAPPESGHAPAHGAHTLTQQEAHSERAAFLARLRSFRPGLWAGRPQTCDALAAARRGWLAVAGEPDVLQCARCGAQTALLLPPSLSAAEAAAASSAFAPKLAAAHLPGCCWLTELTPVSVCAFPSELPPSRLAAAFQLRLASLGCLALLPRTAPPPQEAAAHERIARCAAARLEGGAASEPLPAEVAAALRDSAEDAAWIALCGWRASPSAGGVSAAGLLRCGACGVTVGLWNHALGAPPAEDAAAFEQLARAARMRSLSAPQRATAGAAAEGAAAATLALRAVVAGAPGASSLGLRTIAGGTHQASRSSAGRIDGPFGRKRAGEPSDAGAAKAARVEEGAGGSFEPLLAHRPYCPWAHGWRCEAEGSSEPLLPGWLRTLDAVAPRPAQPDSGRREVGGGASAAALTPAVARHLVARLLAGS
jgi:C3HC zinc finger-like